jgi:hypothetical protein
MTTKRYRVRKRAGMISLESVFVLLVLIIVKQAVSHAATVAARELAKGADEAEVEDSINRILAPHSISVGHGSSFVVERPSLQPQHGSLPCTPPTSPTIATDEVRVTLCVSLTAGPILNVLKPYGIDFTGKTFQVSSVAGKE